MSRVFVATDVGLGRPIVVKVLPPDATAQVSIERFKLEVRVAARLQHPHIVPLLSAGDTQGLPYYTMPFVPGETLRNRLATHGALPVIDAVHVLRDVASALAYAHGEGVVHRDIKPENIILSGGVAVVADFGVAKALDIAMTHDDGSKGSLTSLGVALGTPAYMSPEQAAADPTVDHRADIYSFGCVAYEMLTGSSPFAGRPFAQMLAAHVQEQPEPLGNRCPLAPPALAGLVMSCLAKRPEDRPQSAAALLTALDAISTPSEGRAPTAGRASATRRRSRWIPPSRPMGSSSRTSRAPRAATTSTSGRSPASDRWTSVQGSRASTRTRPGRPTALRSRLSRTARRSSSPRPAARQSSSSSRPAFR